MKIIFILKLKAFLAKNKVTMLFLFISGVLMDMILLEFVYLYVFFPLMALWFLCEFVYRRGYEWYLKLSITLLFLIVPLKFLELESVAEKISIWAYFFLV